MADINLTMTAVSAMAITLSTFRSRLRQELHDEDSANYRWTDATLDRHLARAAREVSLVLPLEQKTTLTTSADSRDLSLSSLTDLVRVDAVEYPTGAWPPCYAQFSAYQSTLTLLVDAAPAASQSVNVYWGSLHTLDAASSTFPSAAEDVVVMGAGGYAALEWASFATNRANVSGDAAFENYRAWGEERLTRFRDALRSFGRESRVRGAALYKPSRGAARQSTVQWGA